MGDRIKASDIDVRRQKYNRTRKILRSDLSNLLKARHDKEALRLRLTKL